MKRLRMAMVVWMVSWLAASAAAPAADGGTAAATDAEQATAKEVLNLYETIQAALAADSTTGVVAAAAAIAEKAEPCACGGETEAAQKALVAAARKMTATDLPALREQLKELSRATAGYLRAVGADGAQIYYCPMAPGYWLQKVGEGMRNPYYGPAMLECGAPVDAISD